MNSIQPQTPRLLITTFNLSAYSETFVRQHIDLLPFEISVLHGENLSVTDAGVDIFSCSFYQRNLNRILGRLGRFNARQFRDRQLANYLKQRSIAVVLAEYGVGAVKIMQACRTAGVPLVAHFHGSDAHNEDILKSHREQYQELFKAAAAIIGVSQDMCAQLKELGAPQEKIFYVPYYVDPNRFEAVNAGDNPPQFLSVGRFVEKKAPQLTVLAFARVLDQFPTARLDMIGDGYLLGPTKQLARAIGVDRAVKFHGAKEHLFVVQAMKTARCFVQHSLRADNGDSEGTPVAVLEAQASGLPVIATRHTGIKDVVVDGETGFLVDECDVSSMSAFMLDLAQSPELATRVGRAGAGRVRDVFGVDKTINLLATIVLKASQ